MRLLRALSFGAYGRRAPVREMPEWASDLLASDARPRVVGADGSIRVWAVADPKSRATTTSQFTTGAAQYAERYADSGHFESLFRQALQETGVTVAASPIVLDLGSGSGANSIVPCLRLFPGARFLATDLSTELLEMLAAYAADTGLGRRIVCVVLDAMGRHVAPGRFDLVTGASILHHLDAPERGLAAAASALRSGGHAIFFEPFLGWAIVRLAFQRILADSRAAGDLDPLLGSALRAVIADIAVRTTPDAALFPHLDDKWLFSRGEMGRMAERAGFSRLQIVPHNAHATLYRDAATVTLRLNLGASGPRLPDWAYDILDETDEAMSAGAKSDLPVEGTLVLTK